MTKPLQGTAFRVMRAELMNCDVNYEDPLEKETEQPICSPRTVSWKSVVATPFKTPHECVGQNGNQHHAEERQTTKKKPWHGKTCGSDVASRSSQEGEA
jgi:hypothetical protein